MYTLSRRYKVSLVIPVLFLIQLAITAIVSSQVTVRVGATSPTVSSLGTALYLLEVIGVFILSVLFLSCETLIRVYITDKDAPQNQAIAQALKTSSGKNWLSVLNRAELAEGTNKVTHSVLFQLMVLVMCFYASTSSNSVLGKGLALSIMLQTLVDMAILLKNKYDLSSWFWQINARFPLQAHQIYFGVVTFIYLLCVIFSLR